MLHCKNKMNFLRFVFKFSLFILISNFGLVQSIPLGNSTSEIKTIRKRALSYIANETVCVIDNVIYQNGDPIPTDDPCEYCKCRPPGFACVLKECNVQPGCKEIPVPGECCPTYQCGCEHDGKFYEDGVIVPNPNRLLRCYTCRCRGSSIICGLIDCFYRYDCQPKYDPGKCCPSYDHCNKSTSSTISVPFNTTSSFFTKKEISNSFLNKPNYTLGPSTLNLLSSTTPKFFSTKNPLSKYDFSNLFTQSTYNSIKMETELNSRESSKNDLIFTTESLKQESKNYSILENTTTLVPIKKLSLEPVFENNVTSTNSPNSFYTTTSTKELDQNIDIVNSSAKKEKEINFILLSNLNKNDSFLNTTINKRENNLTTESFISSLATFDDIFSLNDSFTTVSNSQYDLPSLFLSTNNSSSIFNTLLPKNEITTEQMHTTTIIPLTTSTDINQLTLSSILPKLSEPSKTKFFNDSKDELLRNDDLENSLILDSTSTENIFTTINEPILLNRKVIFSEFKTQTQSQNLNNSINMFNNLYSGSDQLDNLNESNVFERKSFNDQFFEPIQLLDSLIKKCSNKKCNNTEDIKIVANDVLKLSSNKSLIMDFFNESNLNNVKTTTIGLEDNYPTINSDLRSNELKAEHKDSDELEIDDLVENGSGDNMYNID